jgi:hypothetical protein
LLAVALILLLTNHRHLLHVAHSTWAHAGAWFTSDDATPKARPDDGGLTTEAETPNVASYALAPGDKELADGPAIKPTDAVGDATPGHKLSPDAARNLMQERRRELDCELALSARSAKELAKRERKWRWLPPQQAQAERQALRDAAGRLGRGCPHWKDDPDELMRRQTMRRAQLLSAFEANDLTARMNTARPITPQFVQQLPEAMYDALLSGDPELIASIGWADQLWRASDSASRNLPEDFIDRTILWTLVACNLGLDCLAGSPTLDRNCLRDEGVCGSPDLDTAIRPLYPEILMTVLDTQREALLQRIRSGQIAGLFDAPPEPAAGDGP